ncbi:hypothetical protein FA571_28380 [Pseudomonas aeruginosa]|nr:hypothetical protein [Pseudomonas aeruginosa]
MSVRISVESLSGCAWNGCPSQRGIRSLVGRSTRWRPRAYRRRHRELVVSEPLISGSGAIMLWKKSVVKRFVVFFQDYYTKV